MHVFDSSQSKAVAKAGKQKFACHVVDGEVTPEAALDAAPIAE